MESPNKIHNILLIGPLNVGKREWLVNVVGLMITISMVRRSIFLLLQRVLYYFILINSNERKKIF